MKKMTKKGIFINFNNKYCANKEDVLNTLVGGSYTPENIKKCSELITSDKKKNVKTKSET